MPTQQRPRGRNISILMGDQAVDFDTAAASGSYRPVQVYSESISDQEPFEEDPLLGATGLDNNRDSQEPAPGLRRGSGSVTVPLCLNNIGLWLGGLFGAPDTSGEEAPYTHVFASGGEALPYRTIEVRKRTGRFHQHIGCLVAAGRFRVAGAEGGFRRAEFDLMHKLTNRLEASAAGSPLSALALSRVPAAKGIVRVDSTVTGVCLSLDATYDNRPTAREFVGQDGVIAGFDLDEFAASSLTLRVRYVDDTFAAMMGDGSTHAVEIEYPGATAGHKLVLAWPAVRFERGGIPIEGPGGIEVQMTGRAEQTSGAPMLTATLVNAIEEY